MSGSRPEPFLPRNSPSRTLTHRASVTALRRGSPLPTWEVHRSSPWLPPGSGRSRAAANGNESLGPACWQYAVNPHGRHSTFTQEDLWLTRIPSTS
jgi:hypothetical protein